MSEAPRGVEGPKSSGILSSASAILGGNTFNPDSDIPDLAGKTYLVTGGSAGIGFGIVAHLVQHNARVLLLSNEEDHASDAQDALKKWGSLDQVEWIKCDLANLKETDQVADKILEKEGSKGLNGLVFNAGIGVGKYWETVDGLDSHFQVNWLSQLHLTLKLIGLLKKQPGGRLVYQSSDLHRAADSGADFENEAEINQDIGPTQLYNRVKLAQLLGMFAIQRRMENGGDADLKASASDKIFVNATHPGGVSTDQQEQASEAYGTLGKVAVAAVRPFLADPLTQGCRPILFAATSPEIEEQGITGKYIVPDKKVSAPSSKAQDEALQEKLWSLSIKLLKEKLGKA